MEKELDEILKKYRKMNIYIDYIWQSDYNLLKIMVNIPYIIM